MDKERYNELKSAIYTNYQSPIGSKTCMYSVIQAGILLGELKDSIEIDDYESRFISALSGSEIKEVDSIFSEIEYEVFPSIKQRVQDRINYYENRIMGYNERQFYIKELKWVLGILDEIGGE